MPIPHDTVVAVSEACAAGNPCVVRDLLTNIPTNMLTQVEQAEIARLQVLLLQMSEQIAQSRIAIDTTRVGALCSAASIMSMTNLTSCQDDDNCLAAALTSLGFTLQPANAQGSHLRYQRVVVQRRAPVKHRDGVDRGVGESPTNQYAVTPKTNSNTLTTPASKTLRVPATQNPKGFAIVDTGASVSKRALSNTIAPSAGLTVQASGTNNIAVPIAISGPNSKKPFEYNSPGRAVTTRIPTRPNLPYGTSSSTIKLPASATGASSVASRAIADFNALASGKKQSTASSYDYTTTILEGE